MKTVIRLNNTALKESSCIRRLWFKVIEGYKPFRSKIEPEYGIAVHKIAETFLLTKDFNEAVENGRRYLAEADAEIPKGKDYLDIFHLTSTGDTLRKAFSESPIFTNFEVVTDPTTGLPLVEQQFSIPIYSDDDYDVLLQGTIDLLVKPKSGFGCVILRDYKTTASKDKDAFLSGFALASQWRVYMFAVKMLLKLYPENPLSKIIATNPNVGCQNIGIFLDPKLPTSIQASDIFWDKDMDLDEFYNWLMSKVRQIIHCLKYNAFPPPEGTFNGQCQTPFGSGCSFAHLCKCLPQVGLDNMKTVAAKSFRVALPYEPLKVGGGKHE